MCREKTMVLAFLMAMSRDGCRDNELRDKLQLPSIPLVELTVAATRDPYDKVKIRHNDNDLSAISFGCKDPVCLHAALEIVNVPSIAILMFLPEAIGFGKSRVNGDRICDPVLADDSFAVPNAPIQIELAQLELITRTEVRSATEVRLSIGHQVQVITPELQGARKILVEELGKPTMRHGCNRSPNEIQVGGAIDGILSARVLDRKSTRLNSSHRCTSY